MSRRRMIHEGFWTSHNNLYWTLRQRLLFAGIFSLADDQGRIEGHPAILRGKIFPYDDFTAKDIEDDLQAIEGRNCIIRYKVKDTDFIQVVSWWEHQPMQWAKPSDMPAPDGWADRVRYRHDNAILSCNWTTPQGNTVPDNCDAKGRPLPKPLPEALPTPPEIRSSDNDKDKDKDKQLHTAERTAVVEIPATPPKAKRASSTQDTTRRVLQEHFTSVTGLPPPVGSGGAAGSAWFGPLRKIAELVAWDCEAGKALISEAVSRLDGKGLTISDPRSIAKTAAAIVGERNRGVNHNGSAHGHEQHTYEHEVADIAEFRAALSQVQGSGVAIPEVRAGDGLQDGTGEV